jgi:hypothetical protein
VVENYAFFWKPEKALSRQNWNWAESTEKQFNFFLKTLTVSQSTTLPITSAMETAFKQGFSNQVK